MSTRIKNGIGFGLMGTSLFLSLLIFRGIQAGGQPEENRLFCYGGRLTQETRAALERMNRDFHGAKDVWSMDSRRVLIEDRNGLILEYQYSGSTLWLNRKPLVSRIRALNFEFRDEWGNLLTHRSGNCGRVQTIACVLRLTTHPTEVYVNSRTALPWNRNRSRGMEEPQIAFGRPD